MRPEERYPSPRPGTRVPRPIDLEESPDAT